MYAMRFTGEDVSKLTMQQLRGREGARVRRIYRMHAERTRIEWSRRDYDRADFTGGTAVNQALSAANTALYGVVHAVVVALGCSPGLGFVHTGNARSFVYDIADLYKAEITIPVAFDIAARDVADVPAETRRAVRDVLRGGRFLHVCVRDITTLLADDQPVPEYGPEAFDDVSMLWDADNGTVPGGISYGDEQP